MPSKTKQTPSKGKQVRFAYKNTFFSPPSTPALSVGLSTPSSLGPITPPPAPAYNLPGPTPYTITFAPQKPQPVAYPPRIYIHAVLDGHRVQYDLQDPPSFATQDRHALSSRVLCEPATNPPLPYMNITSSHLRWVIQVKPAHGSYVTVEDVLSSIYRSLRTNITQSDFNSLPSPSDQRRVTRSYENRYRRLRSSREYDSEKRGGVKRVDFLMGHTRFMSISNSGHRADEWHLHIA